jgi:hypothetical protein
MIKSYTLGTKGPYPPGLRRQGRETDDLLRLLKGIRMADLYLHSRISTHGIVLNCTKCEIISSDLHLSAKMVAL